MEERGLRSNQYYLKPGYIFLSRLPTIVSSVIGSCVAVSLWDAKECYGGMVHYLYPHAGDGEQATARYGNPAINCLLRMFAEEGAQKKNIQAQIFGGASSSDDECRKVAEENIETARVILNRLKVKIVSEDVGGAMGRKLVYDTSTNEAVVYKSEKLRRGDWYPYLYEDR